jgi:hypothetical protein
MEPNLAFAMTFSPALSGSAYTPGQRYTVTAKLTGAQVGVGCSAQDPNMHNTDNFAASFEDDAGAAAGVLTSDAGQTGPNCRLTSPPAPGTTALDGDCKVVFSQAGPDVDTWTFTWTAPASGAVHIYWGAVDGNCDMMSMKDASITGSTELAPTPARAASHGVWRGPMLVMFGFVGVLRRRRRP